MYFLARLMHNVHFLPPTKRSVMSAVCPSYLPDLNSTLSPKKKLSKHDCTMCKFSKLNVTKGYCKKTLIFEDLFK